MMSSGSHCAGEDGEEVEEAELTGIRQGGLPEGGICQSGERECSKERLQEGGSLKIGEGLCWAAGEQRSLRELYYRKVVEMHGFCLPVCRMWMACS